MTTVPQEEPSTPVLSIVIPLLNEEEVLEETYLQLKKHLGALNLSYELIFVDDGSTDGSRALLAAKSMSDPAVRVVGLSRNFGHEMATTAGLHHARGQAAVVSPILAAAAPSIDAATPRGLSRHRQSCPMDGAALVLSLDVVPRHVEVLK